MKILRGGIQVGQRNERQQGFSRCIDERRIDYIELPIALKLLPGRGIEDLHRAAIFIGRAEKSPDRSASVGTVENASYGVLPRLPFQPAKKNHLLPPLKIFGMFSGPPRKAPKRGRL